MKQALYALDLPEVEALLVGWGFPRELARPLWRALYQQAAADLAALPDLPPALAPYGPRFGSRPFAIRTLVSNEVVEKPCP